MSDTTQHSHKSGDSRRRRSRGGSKRRSNSQGGSRRSSDRDSRDNRGSSPKRSEEFHPQSPRSSRSARPVELTFWQKILKAVGLYKEPVRPARGERKKTTSEPRAPREPRAPKSNTRNARSGDGDSRPDERSDSGRSERGSSKRGKRSADRPRGGDGSTVESPRVYVGNLSYDVSEQDLQELFKGIGAVRNVEIVYNRSTHRSKGYGFVEMLRMDEAVNAVEVLHDQPFMGRNLIVSGAKSKGQDDREEKEEFPDRKPKPVVVAPLPSFDEPVAEAAEASAEATEAQIETIVETAAPAVEEVTARTETEEETKSGNA